MKCINMFLKQVQCLEKYNFSWIAFGINDHDLLRTKSVETKPGLV